ncbi:hypothetical protein SynRS9915_01007 [Synechococcus sp. RS9915]|nr:hypothetical protein SynRS9915_01007 [Synechococcus sp. RS9915]
MHTSRTLALMNGLLITCGQLPATPADGKRVIRCGLSKVLVVP